MHVPVFSLAPVYCLFLILLLTATKALSLGLIFRTLVGQRSSPTMMKLAMNQRLNALPLWYILANPKSIPSSLI